MWGPLDNWWLELSFYWEVLQPILQEDLELHKKERSFAMIALGY